MSAQRLIIGLGNPGAEYELTRHNLGFLVADRLAEALKVKFKACSFTKALIAQGKIDGRSFALLLPQTFMNNSGVAVRAVVADLDLSLSDILVVCDDLDIPFGQTRLRAKGSDGGNNGLRSIIAQLNSQDFPRLRLGIGRPGDKQKGQAADYVLSEFTKTETKVLDKFIDQAVECSLVWLKGDASKAMDQFNRRKKNGEE